MQIIKENVDGMGAAESVMQRRRTNVKINALVHNHAYVVIVVTIVAFNSCCEGERKFLYFFEKGQLPSAKLLSMSYDFELILSGVKYKLWSARNVPHTCSIGIVGDTSKFVSTSVRTLSDGGYLIDLGGGSNVAYLTSKGDATTGMRPIVAGATVAFSADYDPSSLRTYVAGKLVKRLVPNGSCVKKGEPYAEIEVMKMFMPLKVEEAGVVSWRANEGASISPGDLIATLELDNPENVSSVAIFEGDLKVIGWRSSINSATNKRPLCETQTGANLQLR